MNLLSKNRFIVCLLSFSLCSALFLSPAVAMDDEDHKKPRTITIKDPNGIASELDIYSEELFKTINSMFIGGSPTSQSEALIYVHELAKDENNPHRFRYAQLLGSFYANSEQKQFHRNFMRTVAQDSNHPHHMDAVYSLVYSLNNEDKEFVFTSVTIVIKDINGNPLVEDAHSQGFCNKFLEVLNWGSGLEKGHAKILARKLIRDINNPYRGNFACWLFSEFGASPTQKQEARVVLQEIARNPKHPDHGAAVTALSRSFDSEDKIFISNLNLG